jgi:hypothetical protein
MFHVWTEGNFIAARSLRVLWKQNRFVKTIWVVSSQSGSTPERLTDTDQDDAPHWAADGRRCSR